LARGSPPLWDGRKLFSPTWQNNAPNIPGGNNNTNPASAQTYSSDENGISFNYPSGYTLEERKQTFEGEGMAVITIMESDFVIPEMGEGPPSIAIIIVPNTDNLSLEAWIKQKSISNYQLSDEKLSSTTVAGKPAIAYTHSGLYETDAIAVEHEGKIYLMSAGWHDAASATRTDFQNLLKTVQFK
jgi:predicted Zn-dependent protease